MFAIPWPRRSKARRRLAPARPRLEMLEGRVVPAISLVRNLGTAAALYDANPVLAINVLDITSRYNRIIVEVGTSVDADKVQVTDSKGNTYHQDVFQTSSAILSAENDNPLGPGDVIRISFKTPSTVHMGWAASASEWHGLARQPLGQIGDGFGHGDSVNTFAAPVWSPPEALLIGAFGPTWLNFPGYTYPAPHLLSGTSYQTLPYDRYMPAGYSQHGAAILPEYRIVNAAGSYVADGTIAPSTGAWEWTGVLATYYAAPDVGELAAHFDVIPEHAAVVAGVPFSVTVIAKDDQGNVLTNYTGLVRFTSTDPAATPPPDYAFTPADAGRHTFTGVVLRTPGAQTITAQDVVVQTITGSTIVQVTSPAQSAHLDLIPDRSSVAPGAPFSVTVIARDTAGNVLTNYSGTVRLSSSDPAAALPAEYAFTPADAGRHTFAGITLRTPGAQAIAAQDVAIQATAGSTTVQVTPPGGTRVVGTQVMQIGNHGRSMYLLVTLNADVDAASAEDLSHYALFSSVAGHLRRRHKVPLVAAQYDPASCTVVLTVGKRKAADRRATLVVLGLSGQTDLIIVPVNLGRARRR
jgi:hypothetical protein